MTISTKFISAPEIIGINFRSRHPGYTSAKFQQHEEGKSEFKVKFNAMSSYHDRDILRMRDTVRRYPNSKVLFT